MSYRPLIMSLQKHPSQQRPELDLADWRLKGIALLRCSFGGLWGYMAWQSCQPAFHAQFASLVYLQGSTWSTFWLHLLSTQPVLTSYLLAACECVIALGLILGIFTNQIYLGGCLLSIFLWSILEGQPISGTANATSGTTLLFLMVFLGLFLSNAGLSYGLDHYLAHRARDRSLLQIEPAQIPLRQSAFTKTSTGQYPAVRAYTPHSEATEPARTSRKQQRYAPM